MKKILSLLCCALCCIFIFNLTGCAYWEDAVAVSKPVAFYVDNQLWQKVDIEDLTHLPTPTKPYYNFDGWYNFGKKQLEDITGPCNLYVKWSLKPNYTIHEVLSNSMSPALSIGDYIIVDTSTTQFEVGDIVMFEYNTGVFVTHRIVAIQGNYYKLQGDASSTSETITKNQIYGLVCENLGNTLPKDVDFKFSKTANEQKTLITPSDYIDGKYDRFELDNYAPGQLVDWNISVKNSETINLYCMLSVAVVIDDEYSLYPSLFLDTTRQIPSDDWQFNYIAGENILLYTFIYTANMGVMTPNTQSMVFNDGFFRVSANIDNEYQTSRVNIVYGLETLQQEYLDNPDLQSSDEEIRNQAILNTFLNNL